MANEALIKGIKEELSRLLKKRPALEVERCHVLTEVDKAQFMTFELKGFVHDCYNKELASVQVNIGRLTARLKELRAENGSVEF